MTPPKNLDDVLRLGANVRNRFRGRLLALRGAHHAHPVFVGPRCSFIRPQGVTIAQRTVLESDVYLKIVEENASISIGEFAFLGRGVEIDATHRVTIGDRVLIAPGVFITDHNHGIEPDQPIRRQPCKSAPVVIEDDAWIGVNAVILPGVTIGEGAVVGAGAVVTRSIPSNAIAAGIPATVRRNRSDPRP